jgi:membrane protease YdiL (CAAX protease family)
MMKYFREYSFLGQVALLLLITGSLMVLGGVLMITILKFTPYKLLDIERITEASSAGLISVALLMQGIGNAFVFLVPALLFGYLAHPKPAAYLGLRRPGRSVQWLLVVCMMLGAIPLLEGIGSLVSKINFGAGVKASQEAYEHMFKAFLTTPDLPSFVRTFVVLAICPALGEELFFRGILLRFAQKLVPGRAFAMFTSSVIFALIHSNVYGFLSIFIAGMLLAYIYYTTGSIWCSMLGHLVFNGTQILLVYLGSNNSWLGRAVAGDMVSPGLIVGGAVLFGTCFYLLQKNRTPLPENWSNDFTPAAATPEN